jgi:serine/threonine protein kinase
MINSSQLQKIGSGRTATIFRYGEKQVIKLFKPTFPRKAIGEEFQIGLILNHAKLAIPQTYEPIDFNESRGILFEYISGPSMLQILAKRPWMVFIYAKRMARLHFQIHGAKVLRDQGISSLKESLADKISRVSLLTSEEKTSILSHLMNLKDGSSICHGDFHPDNIIVSKDRLVTVDWITAGFGNPIADVARTWLLLTMGTLPKIKLHSKYF